jgi:hypothetical protein
VEGVETHEGPGYFLPLRGQRAGIKTGATYTPTLQVLPEHPSSRPLLIPVPPAVFPSFDLLRNISSLSMGAYVLDSSSPPTSFVLPDLVSHCNFKLSYHPNGDEVAQQSVEWLDSNCPDLNAKQRRALRGLQAGELTAYCYHTASPARLRVVSDFMNYLFHLYA